MSNKNISLFISLRKRSNFTGKRKKWLFQYKNVSKNKKRVFPLKMEYKIVYLLSKDKLH